MRILKVAGENLASLADAFCIDLEAEPIGGTGLFVITGPTGSGKSTILDAICLALYDQLPRMDTADADARIGRDEPGDGRNLLRYSDVRGILCHGAASAFAEVEFVGQDGRRYRARWQVKRARNRPSGKLQEQTLTLTDVETGAPIGDKKTDTLQAIKGRVGLDFGQFCRAVLLAQGDFDAFIKAGPKDRAQLLERITGTDIYARISQAVFRRNKEEQAAVDELRVRLGEYRPLSEEERERAEGRLRDADERIVALTAQRDALARALEWYRADDGLAAVVRQAELDHDAAKQADTDSVSARADLETARRAFSLRAELEGATSALETVRAFWEEIVTLERARSHAEQEYSTAVEAERTARQSNTEARKAYDEIGPILDRAASVDTRIKEAGAQSEQMRPVVQAAERALADADRAHAELHGRRISAEREVAQGESWLADHAPAAVLARQAASVDADVDEFAAVIGEIAASQAGAARFDFEADGAAREHAVAEAAARTAGSALQELEEEAEALRACTEAADGPALLAAREAANRMQTAASLARQAARDAAEAERSLAGHASAIEAARGKAQGMDAEGIEISQALPLEQGRLADARRACDISAAAESERAEYFRSLLEPGRPCPVCGSTEHPIGPGDGRIGERAEADRQRASELQRRMEDLVARRARAEVEGRQARKDLDRLATETHAARGRLAEKQRDWAAFLVEIAEGAPVAGAETPAAPESPDAGDAERWCVALLDLLKTRLQELNNRVEALATADARLKEVEAGLRTARTEMGALARHMSQSREVENERQRQAAVERRSVAEKERRRDATRARLDPILRPVFGEWEPRIEEDPGAFKECCRETAEEHADRQAAAEQARRRLGELDRELAAADMRRATLRSVAEQRRGELEEANRNLDALRAERAGVLGGRPVDEVRTEHRTAADAAENLALQASSRLHDVFTTLTAARANEASARTAHGHAVEQEKAAEAKLTDRLEATGLTREIAAAVLAQGEDALAKEQGRLDAIRDRVTSTAATLAERHRNRARHQAAGRPAEARESVERELAPAAEALKAAEAARTDALFAIQSDDRARRAAADLRTQMEERMVTAGVWGKLDEVIGSADGAKFRRFAQSLTLTRLLQLANHHLKDLAPRYQLERAPASELSLQVVDRQMGDEVRGVHNLSGGERFLVSLALALGLASMSSAQGIRVDSLFIDEGFGALDSTNLSLAVSALESLQATGRKVGVISHVPELKERIAVQIRVSPRGGGRSGIEVLTA